MPRTLSVLALRAAVIDPARGSIVIDPAPLGHAKALTMTKTVVPDRGPTLKVIGPARSTVASCPDGWMPQ